jgi:hypothetical protein
MTLAETAWLSVVPYCLPIAPNHYHDRLSSSTITTRRIYLIVVAGLCLLACLLRHLWLFDIMPSKHHFSSRCSSAGRVTASFLLSFLALSSAVTARNSDSVALSSGGDLGQLPAILPVYPGAGDDKSPESPERFVS